MATSFLRKKLADLMTGNAAYVPPPMYLALFSADPGDAGSLVAEIADGTYARQSLAGKMGAADAVSGISVNTATISFPIGSVARNVVAVAFVDGLTSGNVLQVGHPNTPRLYAAGEEVQFTPGQLRFRVS